jgi:sugar phosphate isomerase/epimerase
MIGISTAWQSTQTNDGNDLLKKLQKTGIECLELEYRVTRKMFREMKPSLNRDFRVSSIHNFFPLPDIVPKSEASADVFRLSSEEKSERENAVKYTLKTIRTAHELEVGVVVLHLGSVPIKTDFRELFRLYDAHKTDEAEGRQLIEKIRKERKEKRQKPLDRVLSSLDRLLSEAGPLNVTLGIENRYHYHEIPDFEEIGIILKEFAGAKIGYWHDVGHAHSQGNLGFEENSRLLETYAKDMIGIHLHGAVGYDDHFAPNNHIDFSSIAGYLRPETVKIIEVHSKVKLGELKEGVQHLRSQGIF